MMRQTKATLTTWGVTGVLTAGLFLFGCNRQTRDAPQHESDAARDTGTADEHIHSNVDEGAEHEMSVADQNLTPSAD